MQHLDAQPETSSGLSQPIVLPREVSVQGLPRRRSEEGRHTGFRILTPVDLAREP